MSTPQDTVASASSINHNTANRNAHTAQAPSYVSASRDSASLSSLFRRLTITEQERSEQRLPPQQQARATARDRKVHQKGTPNIDPKAVVWDATPEHLHHRYQSTHTIFPLSIPSDFRNRREPIILSQTSTIEPYRDIHNHQTSFSMTQPSTSASDRCPRDVPAGIDPTSKSP